MNFFTGYRLLLSLLALSLLLFTTTCSAKLLRVTMFNGRLRTAAMTVHCKSKINDLGPRKLKPAEEFQFEAEASTLYSCEFWLNEEESHLFDIYKPSRDKSVIHGIEISPCLDFLL
ncbi:hypothetical protein Tsubulata_023136 [Turnera subulata]|uniref:S-protein homolog n=1 Tax=Turnera subulata TaxID=218843 RepID=A0A9Q0F4F8_9ROSI|nr:hypothetical protein Tsubulata_023136 [Turnera subulata]